MRNRMLCVLIIIIALSCKKQTVAPATPDIDNYKDYFIPRGGHYASGNDYRPTHIHELKFNALFDSSCVYTTIKEYNAGDVNKLYGFSDCNTPHHENSARFGWKWTGKELEIYAYCYTDSLRQIRSMGAIEIGKPTEMSITMDSAQYIFRMNNRTEQIPRHCSTEYADGYQLYPYFGGDETAPHDIKIRIQELPD